MRISVNTVIYIQSQVEMWTRVYIADAALCSDSPRSLLYELREHSEKYRRLQMATSRSPRFTFVTRVALTFVVIVTLGVTGQNVTQDEATTNGNSQVARSSRAADCACYGGCPMEKGYVLYNKRCLKLYNVKRDYHTANKRCADDGAHLFYFKSRDQDGPALTYLTDTMGLELLPSTRGFWVGATDIVSEGSFVWSDRTPLSKDFPYWNNNQPDDFKGNEDCVEVISVNNVIMLNDFQCLAKLGFVCQVDIRM
ncbi:C-type Lectin CRL-like isoform X2 [Pomacea canaliculata]|uniref:C-type Lectin CRL-like isoform X2 n=1 Tax=Pomacea canaliculata TaxID=400727 RepID=UPI000D72690E|nr:C-type Lectin CRL-like isoform X2 [Pomacea canaliculata]